MLLTMVSTVAEVRFYLRLCVCDVRICMAMERASHPGIQNAFLNFRGMGSRYM